MWSWNGSAWFSILMSVALKSTVVLGVAWILAFLLRGRSAASRHLVWTSAAAAVLALPLLSITLPPVRLPVSTATAPVSANLVFRAFVFATTDEAGRIASDGISRVNGRGNVPAVPAGPGPRFWIVLAWTAGASLSLLQMLVAYLAMLRTRKRALPLEDDGLARRLAHSLELPRPVDVLETAAGGMPMTFGFLRPAVFMPADSAGWSEERRRIVLLHELAHVRRSDAATHLMARTALSLNWWNPLAWIAWREFLKERERATDDLVLTAGARASEYASHLLEVARSMHSAPVSCSAAVAMARRSQLEGRLLAILDSRIDRKPIRGATPAIAALITALLVLPFAAMRAQEQPASTVLPELDATIRAANTQKNHEILEHAASVYENLHKYDAAQALLETALTIRGQLSGQQSPEYAIGLVKLGALAAKRNQPDESSAFYTKAVALGDRPEVAEALVYLGMRAYGKRDYATASELLQRAINVDPQGPHAGPAMTWMASVREAQANPGALVLPAFRTTIVYNTTTAKYDPLVSAEVEVLLQKALATEDPESLDAAVTMELYARFLRGQDRQGEAASFANRAADIRKRKLTDDPNLTGGLPSGPTGVYKVGGGVTSPVVLAKKDPEYTEVARAAKFQGTVLLAVEIGPDGLAHNIRVVRSLGLGLDEKAMEAVTTWRFRPGTKDGEPVTVAATIEVNFRLL